MTLSLYDATVTNYLQTVGAVAGFLERASAHYADNSMDPNDLVETRLFDNMLPLKFQVWSVAHHSVGAIEGVKNGLFGAPADMPTLDYASLQKVIADAQSALQKFTPEEVNALSGKDVTFQLRDFKLPFTAEGFLMSFSLPNFHFHATTAYDILRTKGVPLGKRDYLGAMRMKT